VACTVQKH